MQTFLEFIDKEKRVWMANNNRQLSHDCDNKKSALMIKIHNYQRNNELSETDDEIIAKIKTDKLFACF